MIVIICVQLDPQFWLAVNVYFISIFFNILFGAEHELKKEKRNHINFHDFLKCIFIFSVFIFSLCHV